MSEATATDRVVDDEIRRRVADEVRRRMEAAEHSRLRPFVADDQEGGGKSLVLSGFRDEDELNEFFEVLVALGVFVGKPRAQ